MDQTREKGFEKACLAVQRYLIKEGGIDLKQREFDIRKAAKEPDFPMMKRFSRANFITRGVRFHGYCNGFLCY